MWQSTPIPQGRLYRLVLAGFERAVPKTDPLPWLAYAICPPWVGYVVVNPPFWAVASSSVLEIVLGAIVSIVLGSIPLFLNYVQAKAVQAQKKTDDERAIRIAQLTTEREFLLAERDRERTRAEKAEARIEEARAQAEEAEDAAARLALELEMARAGKH